jgi:integrase/recombinase XerD
MRRLISEMLETLFIRRATIAKHKEAPLLNEREDYLRHLEKEEKCRRSIQNTATVMLEVIRVMKLTTLRQVNMNEIALAAEYWAGEELVHRRQLHCETSARRFTLVARGWFRFHGVLIPSRPACCFDRVLEDFVHEMRCNMGLSPITIKNSAQRIRDFLVWTSKRHDCLYSVTLQDIDDFVDAKRQSGCRTVTLAGHSL